MSFFHVFISRLHNGVSCLLHVRPRHCPHQEDFQARGEDGHPLLPRHRVRYLRQHRLVQRGCAQQPGRLGVGPGQRHFSARRRAAVLSHLRSDVGVTRTRHHCPSDADCTRVHRSGRIFHELFKSV